MFDNNYLPYYSRYYGYSEQYNNHKHGSLGFDNYIFGKTGETRRRKAKGPQTAASCSIPIVIVRNRYIYCEQYGRAIILFIFYFRSAPPSGSARLRRDLPYFRGQRFACFV